MTQKSLEERVRDVISRTKQESTGYETRLFKSASEFVAHIQVELKASMVNLVRAELQALLEFAELQLYNNECNMEGCDAVEFIKWEQCAVLAHAFVQEIKERMK